MFAVFKTGGKQYRVAAEDVLEIDKVEGKPGEIVEFGEVLAVGGDSVTLGTPTIAGATVAAEVLEQGRGAKIIAFKKRRRKNSRRKRGHRQEFTLLRITEILTEGKKPNKTPPPLPKRAPAPRPEQASTEAAGAAGESDAATEKPRTASAGRTDKSKSGAAKAKKPAAKGQSESAKAKKK